MLSVKSWHQEQLLLVSTSCEEKRALKTPGLKHGSTPTHKSFHHKSGPKLLVPESESYDANDEATKLAQFILTNSSCAAQHLAAVAAAAVLRYWTAACLVNMMGIWGNLLSISLNVT